VTCRLSPSSSHRTSRSNASPVDVPEHTSEEIRVIRLAVVDHLRIEVEPSSGTEQVVEYLRSDTRETGRLFGRGIDGADSVAALVTDVPVAVVRSSAHLPPRESRGSSAGVVTTETAPTATGTPNACRFPPSRTAPCATGSPRSGTPSGRPSRCAPRVVRPPTPPACSSGPHSS
jgi:hypothetical protein